LPNAAQKQFQLVDAPLPIKINAALNEDILEMSMDSFFQEYGLMDPELVIVTGLKTRAGYG